MESKIEPICLPTPVPVSSVKSRAVFPSGVIEISADLPDIVDFARIVGLPASVIPITAESTSVRYL